MDINAKDCHVPFIPSESDSPERSQKTQVKTRSATKIQDKLERIQLNRKSNLLSGPTKKRQRIEKHETIEVLLNKFPSRTSKPIEKHIRVKSEARGSCIMCTVDFYDRKRDNKNLKWNDEIKQY